MSITVAVISKKPVISYDTSNCKVSLLLENVFAVHMYLPFSFTKVSFVAFLMFVIFAFSIPFPLNSIFVWRVIPFVLLIHHYMYRLDFIRQYE